MFFLLRMAFWLGLVLMLLPSGKAHRDPAASRVNAAAAVSAAGATVRDLEGFCGREPQACTVGSKLATAMAERARAGARMLYDFLTEAMAPRGASSPGSAGETALSKSAARGRSQDTLTPADLAPAWRGALPHQDGAASRSAELHRASFHRAERARRPRNGA